MVVLGAVADDFTGATDLATSLHERGFRSVVSIEDAPIDSAALTDVDAVIVALKTRTAPVEDAVGQTTRAVRALGSLGPEQYYVKYCSTFDSTPHGNIGPVLDAVLEEVGEARTVVVPAFPDNGRTVYRGHLFVNDQLLSESSMRHHPLTPMTRSRIAEILEPQTARPIAEVPLPAVASGAAVLREKLEASEASYLVVDAVSNQDLATIAEAVKGWRVVSGGSGLALGMRGPHDGEGRAAFATPPGRRLVVCGSASSKTRAQVAHAREHLPTRKLEIARILGEPGAVVEETLEWVDGLGAGEIPVVYTVGDLGDIAGAGGEEVPKPAEAIEAVLSTIVRLAVERLGVRQVIVAGGETSGAVVKALGVGLLLIGPQIAPGVCWAAASIGASGDGPRNGCGTDVVLALKSGNFGNDDLFTEAWGVLPR